MTEEQENPKGGLDFSALKDGPDVGMLRSKRKLSVSEDEDDKDGEGENSDSVGFVKFVKKQLSKLMRFFGEKDLETSLESTSHQDVTGNATAFVAAEKNRNTAAEDVYDFTCKTRGLALIISNENFGSTKRVGTKYDLEALQETFHSLGFQVLSFTNLTALQILQVVRSVSKDKFHKTADCFACAILTHGEEAWYKEDHERQGTLVRQDILFGVDGRRVTTKHVLGYFNDTKCKALIGKPRLFFIQACRGEKYDAGLQVNVPLTEPTIDIQKKKIGDHRDALPESDCEGEEFKDRSSSSEKDDIDNDDTDTSSSGLLELPKSPAPLYQDALVMYATPPGYYAWRRDNGAWFIQSLCSHLKKYSENDSSPIPLLHVLTRVCADVAQNYEAQNGVKKTKDKKDSNPETKGMKAMPVIEHMLRKDIFLSKKRQGLFQK